MVLEPGSHVDPIEAPNQSDETVAVDFRAPTVVFFYPQDGTPDCTTEACQFEAVHERYASAGLSIYGVSTDGVEDHAEFARCNDLEFDLLADPDGRVADSFDVPVDDDRAARTTFVLARDRVLGVYEGVRPDGHARQVLRDVAEAGLVEV